MHAVLDDEPRRCGAALPRRPEGAPQHALEGELEVRVVEHDLRILPAHLEGEALVHPPADLPNLRAGVGGSGEGNERHVGVRDDRRAHRLPDSMHQLDHLRREPRLEHHLHEDRAGVRHILGGLEDAGVSADQCGKHLPGGNRHREVERRHDPRDADRAAKAHRPLVSQFARHRVPEEAAPLDRRVVRGIDPLLHVAPRLGERLPHLPGHQVGDLLLSRGEDVAHSAQYVAAKRRGRRAPQLEAARSRLDRAIDVGAAREGETADHVAAIGGIRVLEVVTR